MNQKLEEYKETIIQLINNKKNQKQIVEYLKQNFGEQRGFSLKSLSRYISQNNLLHKINDNDLHNAVNEMITRVGPSYGRSMLKGALKSININACTHRIARAAVLVDPESHELRVQVKILKMFH